MTTATQLFQPQHLELWTRPDRYIGPDHTGYYYFLGQNRDSDILTQSNFTCGLELLGGESDTVQVIRDSHWACGWIEYILISEHDTEALIKADKIMTNLKNYPVVDDDHYHQLEHDQYAEYAEQEKSDLALALCLAFGLPESLATEQDMLNLAYQLNMEAQFQCGEYGAFSFNQYHIDHDSIAKQLEQYLPDISYQLQDNQAFQLIQACLGLNHEV